MHSRCGGIFNDSFIANFQEILKVKKFWKSTGIWWSYAWNTPDSFFPDTVYIQFMCTCDCWFNADEICGSHTEQQYYRRPLPGVCHSERFSSAYEYSKSSKPSTWFSNYTFMPSCRQCLQIDSGTLYWCLNWVMYHLLVLHLNLASYL